MGQTEAGIVQYYALDRIENGLAVLQTVEVPPAAEECVTVPVRLLCNHLPADRTRPADGTVFYRDEAGQWYPSPEMTARRQQLIRDQLQRLLHRE